MTDSYLPGYVGSAARMMAARSAAERASFVPPQLLAGARVLDVGCGPGSITAGLAVQMGPSGRLVALDVAADPLRLARRVLEGLRENVPRWVVGRASVYALPLAPASVDLVFAHALFEHLRAPATALDEVRRVLCPGGALALVASDWSGARLESGSWAAQQAIEGYRRLRRRAGGDPDAGARLAGWVTAAGFEVCHQRAYLREDMPGGELAAYIAARLALPFPPTPSAIATRTTTRPDLPLAAGPRSPRRRPSSSAGSKSSPPRQHNTRADSTRARLSQQRNPLRDRGSAVTPGMPTPSAG